MQEFSPKQLDAIFGSTARLNFFVGSVRSGKTFCANHALLNFIRNAPPGDMMLLGATQDSIKRNIIPDLSNFLGTHMKYLQGAREIVLHGRKIYTVGAADERAASKIKGCTLAGALVDEGTEIPESAFKMLLSRLSQEGAKAFITTNPDSPYHWLYQEYISQEGKLNVKTFNFTFEDNPSLSKEYIENIKKEYTGLWHKRYVLGQWCLAEGAIYDFFDESVHTIDFPPGMGEEYVVGIDYGTTNPCVFSLIGYNSKSFPNRWLEKEYYYDSQKEMRQKPDSEYADDLITFMEGYRIRGIYLDPSAASFKSELRRRGVENVFDADNDVMNGIRYVTDLLANETYKICKNCTHAIAEYSNYVWDSKAAKRGIDKPLKINDHSMDAQRYALYTHFFNRPEQRMRPDETEKMWTEAVHGSQSNLPHFFRDY